MIRSELRKVRNLLDESIKYQVPDYQRNFEWKRDNADDFWLDLSDGNVFLGTLVLDTANKDNGSISIVDGQQRITIIVILLAACRQLAKKLNSNEQAAEIQRKISFIDDTSGKASASKLLPSASIKKVFNGTIANPDWDGKKFDPKLGKLQIRKLKPIYDFFTEKLTNFNYADLASLLKSLYESTYIQIEVEGTEEALEIFERTNARGMELNEADLIKKYLFEKNASDSVKDDWDNIVDNSSGNILRLLKYYYVSHSGYIQKKDLFKKLKEYGEKRTANVLLRELKEFSFYYNLVTSPSYDGFIDWASVTETPYFSKEYNAQSLTRAFEGIKLFGVTQGHPLLIKAMAFLAKHGDADQKNKLSATFLKFVESIENFHFINYAIAQRPGNQVERYYSQKCEVQLTVDNYSEFLREIVKEIASEKLASRAEFTEKFAEITYENNFVLVYYIYDRLNNDNRTGGQYIEIFNTNKKVLMKNYNIDHLVAQDTSSYDFNEEEISEYIHGIGNLMVISKHTNGKCQHQAIADKLKIFQELEMQNLPEVKILVDEWKDAKWGSADQAIENIQKRDKKLAERAYDGAWKIG